MKVTFTKKNLSAAVILSGSFAMKQMADLKHPGYFQHFPDFYIVPSSINFLIS